MAGSRSLHVGMQINELTECAICTETLSEPKLIPCFHTFCLKCLEQLCQGNGSKKSLPCPLCRTEFIIPVEGMSKLTTNFWAEKLIEAGNCLESMSPLKADQCNCQPGRNPVIYCHDCKRVACTKCKRKHRKHNTMNFKLFTEQSKQQIEDDISKVKNMLENIDLRKIEFEKDVSMLVINFNETKAKIETRNTYLKQQIENQTQSLLSELALLESIEIKKAETMKQQHETITNEIRNFLQCSECYDDDRFASMGLVQVAGEIHSRTEELDIQFESFNRERFEKFSEFCCGEFEASVAVGEIIMQQHKQNNETGKEWGAQPQTISNLPHALIPHPIPCYASVSYEYVEPRTSECRTYTLPYYPAPQFGQPNYLQQLPYNNIIPPLTASSDEEFRIGGRHVAGLVALGKNLYIAFEGFNDISVFDYSDFTYIRSLIVEPLRDPYDITGYGSLLYISEREYPNIYKFRLIQKTTSTWLVGGCCMQMSMTREQNVLATCCAEGGNFIEEYSRFGDLVRRFDLASDIRNPKHAIRLRNGNLVVCHGEWGDKLRRVCMIDSDGNVIKSFGGRWSTAVGSLNAPIRLVSYDDRFILVGDSRNNNVQILTEDLEFKGELVSNERICDLVTLCLNNKNDELFIGDYVDPDSNIMSYINYKTDVRL